MRADLSPEETLCELSLQFSVGVSYPHIFVTGVGLRPVVSCIRPFVGGEFAPHCSSFSSSKENCFCRSLDVLFFTGSCSSSRPLNLLIQYKICLKWTLV